MESLPRNTLLFFMGQDERELIVSLVVSYVDHDIISRVECFRTVLNNYGLCCIVSKPTCWNFIKLQQDIKVSHPPLSILKIIV